VKEFGKLGANVDVTGRLGITPLHFAAKYGHTETVQELVQLGANFEAKDKNDNTTPLCSR
jgi:ankyrin repeat protein